MADTDVAIVGGGPAGLATAIHLAQLGLRCVLLDARQPPFDKACGEGIMPAGVVALASLKVSIPSEHRTPLLGIRYINADVDDGEIAEGRFGPHSGVGVRRTALARALWDRARGVGVDLYTGCGVSALRQDAYGVTLETDAGPLRARYVVGADGLHSKVRRWAALDQPWAGLVRFGLRRHYSSAGFGAFVEVYWHSDVQAYVTPVGEEVGIALLAPGDGRSYDTLLALFPGLVARLSDRPPQSEIRGAGPFRQRSRQAFAGRVALVGDAAGYLDAVSGEGITLAFRCAQALAETVACGRGLRPYGLAYRRLSSSYYRVTGLLLALQAHARLRRRVVRMLAHRPQLFDALLQSLEAGKPVRTFGAAGLFRFAGGVLMP